MPPEVDGARARSRTRRLEEGDFGLLCTLTWSISELHTDQAAMGGGPFGERLLPGTVLPTVVIGLHRSSPDHAALFHRHGLRLGRLLSLRARYVAPVHPGDELTVETTVTVFGAPPGRRIELRDVATNTRGQVVLDMERTHDCPDDEEEER